MPALTICSVCNALTKRSPCEPCRRAKVNQRSHQRGTRQAQGYDAEYQRARAAVIAAQPWCTFCLATEDLTADHIVQLGRGGSSDVANLRTLCRPCNSARGRRKGS